MPAMTCPACGETFPPTTDEILSQIEVLIASNEVLEGVCQNCGVYTTVVK